MRDQEIVEQIEAGTCTPMNNLVIIKRDKVDTSIGSVSDPIFMKESLISATGGVSAGGILLTNIMGLSEDWSTVKAVPKKVTKGDESKPCPLNVGDRVFSRPMDGQKALASFKQYQWLPYSRVEALEVDGQVEPFIGRIIVKKEAIDEMSPGGIIIPDSTQLKVKGKQLPRTGYGEVLKVGPEVQGIEVGDTVRFDKETGAEITVDGMECLVMSASDIYGVDS